MSIISYPLPLYSFYSYGTHKIAYLCVSRASSAVVINAILLLACMSTQLICSPIWIHKMLGKYSHALLLETIRYVIFIHIFWQLIESCSLYSLCF
jgi:hypothetical protein